jgi:hypothetical protein
MKLRPNLLRSICRAFGYLMIWCLVCLVVQPVFAQDASFYSVEVFCEDQIFSEMTREDVDIDGHYYELFLNAGAVLRIVTEGVVRQPDFDIDVLDPSGTVIAQARKAGQIEDTGFFEIFEAGVYTINVYTPQGALGSYDMFISCRESERDVLRSTVIDASSDAPFTGFGFPGLAPVDFANALTLPLFDGTPMTGVITPTGGEILGFQFEANAGDVLDLNLNRVSGNLNLGLVVLSNTNEVVSYGGLITGDTFSTRLTLPSAGQYTVGVFRVDLLPPAAPAATAFQITGMLNP